MAKLITRLAGRKADSSRVVFRAGGSQGFTLPPFWSLEATSEAIAGEFAAYVERAYRENGVVFACVAARAMVFSQARFLWRRMVNGQPADLFGTADLELIEKPWPNAFTGDLLTRMEQDVSMAGNFYGARVEDAAGRRLRRLRPDWVTIVSSTPENPHDYRSRVVAYNYQPPGQELETFGVADIVHYTEMPDPLAHWRGMSWLTPVLREVQADRAATEHKLAYFKHGAKPSVAITYDANIGTDQVAAFVKLFEEQHQQGARSAYKALHLGGGADVTPLTADLKAIDFKATQGAGESRIAAASGAHPVIVPLAEGLSGSSLNAGNFQAARRLFVDGRIRFLWSKAAPALGSVLATPAGAHLWYDDRNIPFLREDAKEEAEILGKTATTIKLLVDAGFDPDRAVAAATSQDLRTLVGAHTGLYSVQLQAAGGADAPPNQGQGGQ